MFDPHPKSGVLVAGLHVTHCARWEDSGMFSCDLGSPLGGGQALVGETTGKLFEQGFA